MADKLQFQTPANMGPTAQSVQVVAIHKRSRPRWHVHVEVADELGRTYDFNFDGPQAKTIVSTLNTSNNTLKTEQRRVLEYLVQQGLLSVGTYSTVPDEDPAGPSI